MDELRELIDQRAKVQKGHIAGDFKKLVFVNDAFALEACVCEKSVDPLVGFNWSPALPPFPPQPQFRPRFAHPARCR